ncbi:MAG: T9SS type A sorting domain-containing protein [Saprospiraceae bacterium]|nr:T9SS type A sorting domain-containing protein [Saprospiraceae bacterium]
MNRTSTKFLLLCLSLISGKSIQAQDYLVDFVFLGSRSKFELQILFGAAVDYDINLYRIRYETPGSDNLPDTASGLMVLPVVPAGTQLPMVVYEHGTTSGPTDVPSQLRGGFEVAMGYAAFGFITLAPDYLGLGDSRGFHPYVHAATEASASLDMINGGLEYLDTHEPDWDPNFLFLAGYSQGGHASMALHKEIEDFWSFVYPVTAATHMSGPYSISGVMRDLILSDESYGSPAYIGYLMLGYNEVYGNLYTDLHEIFVEPYVTSIQNFKNGTINLTVLNSQLIAALAASGDTINKRMFQDSIIEAITSQPNHPINVALNDNDVYNWAPSAPTRLYYCGSDEQVPNENSIVAEATMQGLGAPDVHAINLNPALSHGGCVFPAITASIAFFKSFVFPSAIEDLNTKAAALKVYPNPVQDEVVIDWEKAQNGMDYEVINSNGQTMDKGHSYFNNIRIGNLPGGIYVIVCTAGGETRMTRFVHP